MDTMNLPGADAFGRLSRKDTAALLKVSAGTLVNWAVERVGPPAYRQRGRVYYLASEVRDFALRDARGEARSS